MEDDNMSVINQISCMQCKETISIGQGEGIDNGWIWSSDRDVMELLYNFIQTHKEHNVILHDDNWNTQYEDNDWKYWND